MTVLVTGATGTIGRHLVRELTETGQRVRAMVRTPERAAVLGETDAEIVVANLDDAGAVDDATDGAERVVLIAGNSERQSQQEINVIDAAARHGAAQLIKVSVGGAVPDAPLALARAHYRAEERLRASGTPAGIIRPGFMMDNFFQYASWIGADGVWPLPLGEGAMAMIDARDVAVGAAVLLRQEPEAWDEYVWTGPEALTMAEAAKTLSEATGRTITYVDGDPEQFYERYVADGNEEQYARDITTLYDVIVRANWVAEVSPGLEFLLGRAPRTFAEFAAEYASTFRA